MKKKRVCLSVFCPLLSFCLWSPVVLSVSVRLLCPVPLSFVPCCPFVFGPLLSNSVSDGVKRTSLRRCSCLLLAPRGTHKGSVCCTLDLMDSLALWRVHSEKKKKKENAYVVCMYCLAYVALWTSWTAWHCEGFTMRKKKRKKEVFCHGSGIMSKRFLVLDGAFLSM